MNGPRRPDSSSTPTAGYPLGAADSAGPRVRARVILALLCLLPVGLCRAATVHAGDADLRLELNEPGEVLAAEPPGVCRPLPAGIDLERIAVARLDIDLPPAPDDEPPSAFSEQRVDEIFGGCETERRLDFHDDLDCMWPALRDDARGIVNWNNAVILGGALAASIALRQEVDGHVRDDVARHPERWGAGTKTLGRFAEPQYQIPLLLAVYGLSLRQDDECLHDFSSAVISAYTINGLSTLAVKGIANTDRPSDEWIGGHFGFPSFHASSSFTIAAVVDEYYGPKLGLPAYALAGLISWSRIDERDHDLSDVVFGAAMGYVIGHAVAGRHLRGDSRVRLFPYVDPLEGTGGLWVDVSF